MFVVLPSDEVVGWSVWPWDELYAPVAGCFVSGGLVAAAACDRAPGEVGEPPSAALAARLGRRLSRAVGREPAPPLPPFEGPARAVWFRMAVPAEAAARLRAHDPAVRLERLEDGALIPSFDAPPPASGAIGALPVEALLDAPEGAATPPLDGFAAFLAAPPLHQLEVVFFEYLRRLPEAAGRRAYLAQLESGELTALGLRDILLASDEFKLRRVGYGARLGASLTTPAWRRLADLPTLLEAAR